MPDHRHEALERAFVIGSEDLESSATIGEYNSALGFALLSVSRPKEDILRAEVEVSDGRRVFCDFDLTRHAESPFWFPAADLGAFIGTGRLTNALNSLSTSAEEPVIAVDA